MLSALTLILTCQLAGELITRFLGLPVPGPVAGMVILFALLALKGKVPDDIGVVADGLLRHLALLFVPAGVGIMAHLGLIGQDWLPISVAVVGSTLATIAVTGLMMSRLARPQAGDRRDPGHD
ncbi:MAG: CidA/LrgA family protein [Hoeflea sp.]|uniref:CidA/LrgA family protein n=1 Tax=Hoeflea sp. TaxID=1940281 RepID=UPI001E14C075|nr:CidA/LrgA family protein [Hoeflea sp.]MBU4529482.1 CidA/LrgA family protein [Alphaproteobacteria bacterium]MBU4546601.1 CidA/LrgA family protein [Alphaproteobacteria bacterium]MBU4550869.1 CidA/LrgA family protein [Alphaproteobacteria bacterium]MBV1723811.1 CidA/LrgA family protein [Hoeflea sp.]MBV1763088.1 CidA/LrgA family protein [Hoeflea sp.]